MPKRPSFPKPAPPDGWITRAELIAATGVSGRNLLNWCAAGLLPRPVRHFLGPGRTVAFYRAESVAMIHRLHELQQQSRDADTWLWGLWVDPADYPIDIRPWISRRLGHAQKTIKAIGDSPDEIEQKVTDALKQARAHNLRRRGINPYQLRDLMLWAYRVAADIEQQERIDSPGSEIFATLLKLGGLPASGFTAPDKKLGVELMSIAWFQEIIEQASVDDLEQVRRDCRAIDGLAAAATIINWRAAQPSIQSAVRLVTGDLPEPRSVRARKEARKRLPAPNIVRLFLFLWGELDVRGIAIPGLIGIRKLPEYGMRLTKILASAVWLLELAKQLPESSRRAPPEPKLHQQRASLNRTAGG